MPALHPLSRSAARPGLGRAVLLLLAALCLPAALAPRDVRGAAPAGAPRYTILVLASTNGLLVNDLNDHGQVTGSVWVGGSQAFRTRPLQPFNRSTDLLGWLPGGNHSVGRALNNAGQVVGQAAGSPPESRLYAFRTEADGLITEESLLGPGALPSAINNNGEVTGTFDSRARAFRANGPITEASDMGTLFPHPTSPGDFTGESWAHDINDAGTVVGRSWWGSRRHGFRSAGGKIAPGDDLGDGLYPEAINEAGSVVGWSDSFGFRSSGPGSKPELLDMLPGHFRSVA